MRPDNIETSYMKRILVPCDFSEQAIEAYQFALNISAQASGEVFVLKVIELPLAYVETDDLALKGLEAQAKKEFEKMKTQFPAIVKVTFVTIRGAVSSVISQFIKDHKISLVVMGTRGSSGLREYVIGSNAEKTVRFSAVPVFAVRKFPQIDKIRNIVFPTSLEMDQVEFVSHVKELQSFFNATLHLLLVNTPYNFKRSGDDKVLMEEYAKHYKLRDYTLNTYDDYRLEDGIINFANSIKADMIAIATHGHRGLAHLFVGSVAEDIVNHKSCPIWTYRLEESKM
ncbi:universal stress protein UspA [Cytophagales bacterium WSM2-2]|nr:universal stress protein UspA [Cytophagales bacterium WSM2-2]